ncbi:MAG: site-specific DNA-methyltransferase [Kiritimatiellae bacterium]|nr:site-specific DNA-methyltransferase [Kiritimatiellia bacterium]
MNKTIQDKMPTTPDLNQERLEQLRALMPDLFSNDGALDRDELKRLVDPDSVAETERFEFRWFGKANAKRNAFTPTVASLEVDPTRSVNPELANGNAIIEGENLEVLKCLLAAYRNRIKCIYIDPPYNKDKDFVYSDTWKEDKKSYWEHIGVTSDGVKIDTNTKADGRFHSNWLNMLYPRLLLARQLLKNDGVIFISIDDNEVHHLRKLCDQAFGEENFVAQLTWEKTRKNDAKLFSVGHDYVICYARDIQYLKDLNTVWREQKPGAKEICKKWLTLKEIHGEDYETIETELRKWYKDLPAKHASKKLSRYKQVDKWGPWRDRDISWPGGDGPRYDVIHPGTGKPCAVPADGWRFSTPESMQRQIDLGLVEFREDHTKPPFRKAHLIVVPEELLDDAVADNEDEEDQEDVGLQVMPSVLYKQSQVAIKYLRKLLGGKIFDNPKDHEILARLIEYVTKPGDLVLDFFAGSGPTGQAVMDINTRNGGSRSFILVQLPELIEEKSTAYKAGYRRISDITIERNRRVVRQLDELASQAEEEAKKELPGMERDALPSFRTGFKVYKLAKSRFPRTEFEPDPEKADKENVEAFEAYIREKETAFLMTFAREYILQEVLLKRGFMLDVQTEVIIDFTKNIVFRVWDSHKEATVCLDYDLKEESVAKLRGMDGIFICLEQALNTTKKWNLRAELGERLVAF